MPDKDGKETKIKHASKMGVKKRTALESESGKILAKSGRVLSQSGKTAVRSIAAKESHSKPSRKK